MKITIYTDGSSRGNPGPGGWGTILLTETSVGLNEEREVGEYKEGEVIELGGREDLTTNNRMELMAAIMGLKEIGLQSQVSSIEVCTDSQYVKKGITEWIDGWIKKGWIGSTKKAVLNRDLWELLKMEQDRLIKNKVAITWKYVPGHAGVHGNERADYIATACADNANNLQLYRGSRKEYPYF